MNSRRTYLKHLGAGAGIGLLAGCVRLSEEPEGSTDGNASDSDERGEEQPESTDEEESDDSTGSESANSPPAEVHDALEEQGANNYGGEMAERTGQEVVEVAVGAGDAGLAFDPPAVHVDPGTELRWVWTGAGGAHNVFAETLEGAFDSGEPVDRSGSDYAVVFEADGNYIYSCAPHQAAGMVGAVVVGEGGKADPDAAREKDDQQGYDGPAARADQYLRENGTQAYDGEFADFTGTESVSIAVGAAGDGGSAFDPPAIRVGPGTEIVWEWTGSGGAHNVVSADQSESDFDSGEVTDEAGTVYTRVFERSGAHLYYCAPHQALGMCGAIVVEE
jgi:halocyanin-like protein